MGSNWKPFENRFYCWSCSRGYIYIVAKLKIFNKINRTTFNNSNNYIPMERNHYICIPVIDIDSVINIDKRVYP